MGKYSKNKCEETGGKAPGKQSLTVGGELLAHDAIEFLEPYAAIGVAHGSIGSEAHKIRIRHVDRRLEVLLTQVSHSNSWAFLEAQNQQGKIILQKSAMYEKLKQGLLQED